MYCPKCGSEQLSDAVRFCSRCGLPLDRVARLVAIDGRPLVPGTEVSPALKLYRRVIKRPGAKLVFLSVILIPFMLLCSIAADSPIPLMLDFGIFLLGLIEIVYHHLFRADEPTPVHGANIAVAAEPRHLRPASEDPNTWPATKSTAEMVAPPSVTESTTRLLDPD